jgi:5-methylcytosine-specific restriction endonuclease McrA
MKQCVKCSKIKPLTEFYKDSRTTDGLYCSCKKCHDKRSRNWAKNNIQQFKEYQEKYIKKWKKENPERVRELNKKHYNKISKTPFYKVNKKISRSIRYCLKGNKNGRPWETLVGYTLEELIAHLESKFEDWMTWDNHGIYEEGKLKWQIDHIRPISSFNFTSPEDKEFKDCWALENLQPLEATENLKKGNKY